MNGRYPFVALYGRYLMQGGGEDTAACREHDLSPSWLFCNDRSTGDICMRPAESPVNWFTGVVQSPEQIEVTSDGIR